MPKLKTILVVHTTSKETSADSRANFALQIFKASGEGGRLEILGRDCVGGRRGRGSPAPRGPARNGRQCLGRDWGRPPRGGPARCGEHVAARCWTPLMAAVSRAQIDCPA